MAVAFDSPKLTVHVGDGIKFVEENKGEFDIVIVDCTDPVDPNGIPSVEPPIKDPPRKGQPIYIFQLTKRGQPLYKGPNSWPQSVLYSEVPP